MELKRTIGFFTLTMYGVGIILGAGVYALIGEAAGETGTLFGFHFLSHQ